MHAGVDPVQPTANRRYRSADTPEILDESSPGACERQRKCDFSGADTTGSIKQNGNPMAQGTGVADTIVPTIQRG